MLFKKRGVHINVAHCLIFFPDCMSLLGLCHGSMLVWCLAVFLFFSFQPCDRLNRSGILPSGWSLGFGSPAAAPAADWP